MRMISYLAPGYPPELFEALARHVGAEVEFEVGRSGPDPADDPFAAGEADLGWVCSTSFVELTTGGRRSVREVGVAWVPDDPDAADRPVYFSDVLVPADSDARSLDDLADRRIGCNDPASLSGFHALRIELDRRGHGPADFAQLVMTGGHGASIDRLLARDVDATVVDSIVRTRRVRDRGDLSGLRLVERLGPWPTQPLVIRADVGDAEVDDLRRALLDADHDPRVRELMRASALVRLTPTPPDHCESVRRSIDRLRPSARPVP